MTDEDAVAVIGLAGRFPGAADVRAFWRNLTDGVDSVRDYTADELRAAGVPAVLLADPRHVRSAGHLDDVDRFDAEFFGYPAEAAELLDPQHRLFLETAWHVVEDAGYDVTRHDGSIGVFAGAAVNHYLLRHLLPGPRSPLGRDGRLEPGHTPDYLPARVSYRLGLTGPSVAVQTACSSSLTAVCLAAQAVLDFRCDLAIAGGVAVTATTPAGYLAADGGVLSPDGRCRAFDVRAAGAAPGNGVGAVLLKRLDDALADGDHVYAVLRGWAVTSEGADRAGFLVPGVHGQAALVTEALGAADLGPESIGFVEASAGGTAVGDAIEVEALRRAFAAAGGEPVRCALGSVKTNVGNLDAASGVTSLIKAVLAVQNGIIPANINFERANPDLGLTADGFWVPDKTTPWPAEHEIRRAAVTALGMGGTNAHVIVEQSPVRPSAPPAASAPPLVVSARTPDAVRRGARRLADHLDATPALPLSDVAATLTDGRRAFGYRATISTVSGGDARSVVPALRGELTIEQAQPEPSGDTAGGGRRVPLPGYPFAAEKHWVAPPTGAM
jgi:acyl transferase domain-containing protein